jgi:hypothetical protein
MEIELQHHQRRHDHGQLSSDGNEESTSPGTDSNSNGDYDHNTIQHQNQQLPPADGGKDAWLFLFACFMIEGFVWGIAPLRDLHIQMEAIANVR